jgi:hypothetical protein
MEFTYKEEEYVTGVRNVHGWAYSCVYHKTKWLWFSRKRLVFTNYSMFWPWHHAINSTPDLIKHKDTQVILMFKEHANAWEGKEKYFK